MGHINIQNSGQQLEYKSGQSLMTTLIDAGVFIENPCNGKGTCGKCKVKIIEGQVAAPCETERKLLSHSDMDAYVRLSCMIYPEESLVIEMLQHEKEHRILSSGHTPEFKFNPAIQRKRVSMKHATLEKQVDYETLINRSFETHSLPWRLLSKNIRASDELTGVLYNNHLIDLKHASDKNDVYGLAIDIGTTTLVAALVNLETGKEIGTASMINPQKHYGLDVLTRITYAMENKEEGSKRLQTAIVQGINDLIVQLSNDSGIAKELIYEIVVAGNTTMLHLLLGVDSTVIGRSPYAPIFVTSKSLRAKEIGLQASEETMLYCMPSVSAYIGSDIVAGTYVCALDKSEETTLFIDIGTNGEIVLAHEGRLISCSCAAGPALEGMNISSGMRAQEGAIEEISISEKGVLTQVIGDTEGTGLCGSGILAVLREMIKTGIVTKKGAMIKLESLDKEDYRRNYLKMNGKKRELHIGSKKVPIVVTQSDVRQVQLAKGAILSGFYALLNEVGIEMKDLDRVVVAGQFGAHLSAESLIGTGILPVAVRDKLDYVGNASKTGAYMALMSIEARHEIELLAERMEYMELGATEGYERLFAKSLLFY